jgi:tripartite-type tricarboxylate transporter receptor subunit TctC
MNQNEIKKMAKKYFLFFLSQLFLLSVHADTYPSKPIKIVVPAPVGSANDLLVRSVADELSKRLQQPLIIDNKAGAGAILGSEIVARSSPDGYTLLSANVVHAINGSVNKKLPFDPVNDFSAISLIGYTPSVLMATSSSGISTLQELILNAKKMSGDITYATAGPGTAGHLSGELFNKAAKIKLSHIPYKGITQGITDALGGHVQLIFLFGPDAVPLYKNGKLKALAVTASQRSSLLSEVPTFSELGYPMVELTAWYGFLGPAKIPTDIITRLNSELKQVLLDTKLKQRLSDLMFESQSSTPAELDALIRRNIINFNQLANEIGMKAE